jgi:hypothetical protein
MAFHFLATIEAALAPHAIRLHRLAVDDPGIRLGIAAQVDAERLTQRRVDPLPGPIQAPFAKVMKTVFHGGRSWGSTPLAATPVHTEGSVEDAADEKITPGVPAAMVAESPAAPAPPFGIRHINSNR